MAHADSGAAIRALRQHGTRRSLSARPTHRPPIAERGFADLTPFDIGAELLMLHGVTVRVDCLIPCDDSWCLQVRVQPSWSRTARGNAGASALLEGRDYTIAQSNPRLDRDQPATGESGKRWPALRGFDSAC